MKKKQTWIWEFSKKIVITCSVLYVFGFIFSCIAMWYFCDLSCLNTFIEQSSHILETCVFGYLVKAGVENVFKIKSNNEGKG